MNTIILGAKWHNFLAREDANRQSLQSLYNIYGQVIKARMGNERDKTRNHTLRGKHNIIAIFLAVFMNTFAIMKY